MELFKVIGVGLVGVCATLLLKNTDNRYAILAGIATGAVILIVALNSLSGVIVQLHALVDKTGVDSELFAALLKIVGIGYVTEYTASVCADADCASIGRKVAFAGKIAIFLLALPIVKALLDIVAQLV
ncbi:MAG TPA: hypothetical protein IAA90_07320 [Candidatus Ornithoclostridium excrementipullorum]|nr:hypothetical protein [Candidatus Ornithoclostridium excrementipullorum]